MVVFVSGSEVVRLTVDVWEVALVWGSEVEGMVVDVGVVVLI